MTNEESRGVPLLGTLHLEGYAGRAKVECEVIGETPASYKIKPTRDAYRYLAGFVYHAPKYAVQLHPPRSSD